MNTLRGITSKFRAPMLLVLATALVLGAACGGDGDSEPENITAIYDTLPVFPGAAIDGGPVAPATLVKGDIETFKNDRRMFVASPDVRREHVLEFYAEEIPKLGWEVEEPAKPKAEDMKNYCSASFVTCQSYLKDDVRMIISAPIQLQLNPIATQGVSFHIHLEGA